jgi:hypothetical protein
MAAILAHVAKPRERELALGLVERHPGWSDRRIARVLCKRHGLDASHASIGRWRRAAGFPIFVRWNAPRRRERLS